MKKNSKLQYAILRFSLSRLNLNREVLSYDYIQKPFRNFNKRLVIDSAKTLPGITSDPLPGFRRNFVIQPSENLTEHP